MAEAVGTVRVDLFANLAQWSQGLTKAEGQLKRFATGVEKVGKGFEKAGQSMARSLTLPLVAFGGFAIKAASDAQDLQGAFNISFGSMADEANAWAVATGDALGRSTQTIQTTANAFQALFEDIAPTEKAAAELSMRFTELTADFAAFANVSDEQATKVLTGGLAGAGKALKRLGIDVGEAATEARAFELGIARVGQELTEQQKTLARATIIMDGFGKAQGEIARSTNDTEQITRKTREEFQELLVTVGDQLLPAFNAFLRGASQLISEFTKLDAGTQQLALGFGAVLAAVGPLSIGIGVATKASGALIKIAGSAIGVIGGFGTAMTKASGGVDKLGLSLRGAIGWFAALAPVAYEAGRAIGSIFSNTPDLDTERALAEVMVKNLEKTGLTAIQARQTVKAYYDALAAGKPITEAQAIAQGKLAATYKGEAHDAFSQSVDDAINEAAAMDEANKATAETDKTLKELIASFGNLGTATAASAAELQAVRDKIDPIGAAVREYHEQLALAKQAGVDTATAQRVLSQQFVAGVKDVAGYEVAIANLPPELQRVAEQMQVLEDRAGAFDIATAMQAEMDDVLGAFQTAFPVDPEEYFGALFEADNEQVLQALKDRAAAIYDISTALTDAATDADNFGESIKRLIVDALKSEIIKPFISNILNGVIPQNATNVTGALGGIVGNAASAVAGFFGFGGSRDKGGPVMPGMAYKIGHGVEEVFRPSVPGTISREPGGATAAGATIIQNFNGTLPDQHSRRQAARQARLGLAGA